MRREEEAPVLDESSPWPGLAAFSEQAQRFFHGRTVELEDLFRRVRRETLTVLYAQSGLGKTSLLQAGLSPRLREEGFLPIPIRLEYAEAEAGVRADADPSGRQVAQAIARAITARGLTEAADPMAASGPWEYLHDLRFTLPDETGSPLVPVLVFDQFEELFTFGADRRDEGRFAAQVIELLGDLIENRVPRELERLVRQEPGQADRYDFARANYRILLSLREDFLPHLHGLRTDIPSIILNNVRLTRFDRRKALEAVEKPAQARGLVTRTVAEAIVQAVAGKEAGSEATGTHRTSEYRTAEPTSRERPGQKLEVDPALLSIFCQVLNALRIERREAAISLDLVARNRETVLRDFYLRCFEGLSPPPAPGVKAFVEDFLLTSKGYRDRLTVERATEILVEEYHGRPEELGLLVKRRLLQIEERGKTPQLELTHDVLAPIALAERQERKRSDELRRVEREAAEAKARARRDRTRALVIGTGLTLGLVAAGLAASWSMKQARDLRVQKATADSARHASDRNAFRAESLLARSQAQTLELEERNRKEARLTNEALVARDRAREAALAAQRSERRSGELVVQSCDQTLKLLGIMADSAAENPQMAGVFRNFLDTSEDHIAQLRRQDSTAICPVKLEARVRTMRVATLRDQRQTQAAVRKAAEALPSVRLVARQPDPDSRWLASSLYLELATQLFFLDATGEGGLAQQAAREGIEASRRVDPSRDSNALNRLARLHQFLANSSFSARQFDEARRAADSGIAVVRRGLAMPGQDQPRLLFTESQIHIRLAELDSVTGRAGRGEEHYLQATRAAAERADRLKTTEAERWLARIYEWRGQFLFNQGNPAAARVAYDSADVHQEAIFERQRAEGSPARVTATGDTLVALRRTIARLGLQMGDTAAALEHYRQNVETAQAMSRAQPSLRNRRSLSAIYNQLGDALRGARQLAGADSAFREQLNLDSLFLAAEGRTRSNLDNLAFSFGKMAQISFDRDRFPDARYYGRQRVALRRELVPSAVTGQPLRPAVVDTAVRNLAAALGSLSWYELFGGTPDSAAAYASEAIQGDSTSDFVVPNRANALLQAGRNQELEELLRTGRDRLVETNPRIPLHCAVLRDARVLRARGFTSAAQLALLERLVAGFPACPAR